MHSLLSAKEDATKNQHYDQTHHPTTTWARLYSSVHPLHHDLRPIHDRKWKEEATRLENGVLFSLNAFQSSTTRHHRVETNHDGASCIQTDHRNTQSNPPLAY